MNRSMPGLPVHHQLLEFTQTHVHRVGDAIQSSHPLCMGNVKNRQIEIVLERTDLILPFSLFKKSINLGFCAKEQKVHVLEQSSDSMFFAQFCSVKSTTLK